MPHGASREDGDGVAASSCGVAVRHGDAVRMNVRENVSVCVGKTCLRVQANRVCVCRRNVPVCACENAPAFGGAGARVRMYPYMWGGAQRQMLTKPLPIHVMSLT